MVLFLKGKMVLNTMGKYYCLKTLVGLFQPSGQYWESSTMPIENLKALADTNDWIIDDNNVLVDKLSNNICGYIIATE